MIKKSKELTNWIGEQIASLLVKCKDIGIDLAIRRVIENAYIQGINDALSDNTIGTRLAEAEKKSGWISVKDELPPLEEQVFVLYRWGDEMQWCDTCDARIEENKSGLRYWSNGGFYNGAYEVIAWHPLPDIPNE